MSRWPRWARRTGCAVTFIVLGCLLLSSCGQSRSAENYCSVLASHRERYLAAMGSAQGSVSSQDALAALGGLAQAASALADLQQMWTDLAEVAPDEIRTDTEAVRDIGQKQQDALAGGGLADPLGALSGGLFSSIAAAGPMGRIDTYVRTHCTT